MAKGAVDLDDQVMVFSLFPTSAFLCVMVKQINFKLLTSPAARKVSSREQRQKRLTTQRSNAEIKHHKL